MAKMYGAERALLAKEELQLRIEKAKKLLEYLASEAEALRKDGVSIGDDFRLSPDAYGEIYTDEQRKQDREYVAEMEAKYYPGLSEDEIRESELATDGTQFEILKTALFHKKLKGQFIVVRASRFDDILNGVDNVLVDRRTGKVVCAFDEVSDNVDIDYRRKRAKLDNQNTSEGAQLKYGLSLDVASGGKVKLGLQT
ncbi:MAG TPA: hypothetical protein VJG48_03015 [Candidatus Paceibacterota bacterium]